MKAAAIEPRADSQTPTVSVCVRAFARPDWLHRCIDGVLEQTYRDFELIVSDDSGRLGPVVAAFRDSRVRYSANPRPAGSVANLERVIGLARGRLLALLDDDDRWLPGFLAAAVDQFERDAEVGVVFSNYFLLAGGLRVRRESPLAGGRHDAMVPAVLEHSQPPSAAVMRRAVWEDGQRTHPLHPRRAGALHLWLRAAAAGWPFYYLDEPLVEYGMHDGQMSWVDARVNSQYAETLELFRFDDPESERLRRARLAEARLVQTGLHLRSGRLGKAVRDMRRARSISPGVIGARGWLAVSGVRTPAVRFLARHPRVLAAGLPVWRRLRPEVR
jgi:glycosyltransferase involved in cell wall biosynthesis